jgi:COP9 signalosome complex subunit 2
VNLRSAYEKNDINTIQQILTSKDS